MNSRRDGGFDRRPVDEPTTGKTSGTSRLPTTTVGDDGLQDAWVGQGESRPGTSRQDLSATVEPDDAVYAAPSPHGVAPGYD